MSRNVTLSAGEIEEQEDESAAMFASDPCERISRLWSREVLPSGIITFFGAIAAARLIRRFASASDSSSLLNSPWI